MRRTYTTLWKGSFELMDGSRDHLAHVPPPRTVQRIAMTSLLIRAAHGADGAALQRLAALDSARVPLGELLVAEADGALVAAHAPATGATIADPFRHTAEVVELLELRGSLLRAA
jgi:hypothetical protein